MSLGHLVNAKETNKRDIIIRQKQARFPWFLAYTIINSNHLFDLRKRVQSRLVRLRIEGSSLIDVQKHADTNIPESPEIKQRKMKYIYSKKFYCQIISFF
jgi:hypothetical protein